MCAHLSSIHWDGCVLSSGVGGGRCASFHYLVDLGSSLLIVRKGCVYVCVCVCGCNVANIKMYCPPPPGAELNRIKKNFQDVPGRKTTHLKGLSEELQGVQKIMFENIDAVLQRGELISGERGGVCG